MTARGQDLLQRPHHERKDLIDEEERDQEAHDDGEDRDDQSLPELVEMLQERHLAAGFVGFELVVEILVRGAGRVRPGKRDQRHEERGALGARASRT
jgi:hypothetical protein